jgi:hypothetical protein
MTEQEMQELASAMADGIVEHTQAMLDGPKVAGAFAIVQARLQTLESENTQLKNRIVQLEAIEAARDEVARVDR